MNWQPARTFKYQAWMGLMRIALIALVLASPSVSFAAGSASSGGVSADNVIQNRATLQAGATFYVSSGTVSGNFNALGTISGSTGTFSGQLIGLGTPTNDDACIGCIGEYVSSTTAALTNFPSNGNYGDLASISLTAGDWDVMVFVHANSNGGTWSRLDVGASTSSGGSSTGLVDGDTRSLQIWANSATTPLRHSPSIPRIRFKLTATTTIYLKYRADYTAGQPNATGTISARRVR